MLQQLPRRSLVLLLLLLLLLLQELQHQLLLRHATAAVQSLVAAAQRVELNGHGPRVATGLRWRHELLPVQLLGHASERLQGRGSWVLLPRQQGREQVVDALRWRPRLQALSRHAEL